MMGTWYGKLLISEYGIAVLILGYGSFHGYFIIWWLYDELKSHLFLVHFSV